MISFLSKSQFLRGLQCHKSLWLLKNRPELRAEPDEALENLFRSGHEVGLLARGLFPGGVEIPFDSGSFAEKARQTDQLIRQGATTLYEAVFSADNALVVTDILHRGSAGWELYEVKRSASVKDVHLDDVAFQCHVIREAGFTLSKAVLVHVDCGYVRQASLDIKALFCKVDLTDAALRKINEVVPALFRMRQMLSGGCPAVDIGPHCNAPYDCDFMAHCWAHIPKPSVFDLRGRGLDKFASYRLGNVRFDEIDLRLLDERQRMQVEAELTGRQFVDSVAIRTFLPTLRYPLYFLDFETFYDEAVPPFDGSRPYAKIPFQYSLHWQQCEGGELEHDEFLAPAGEDGREEIATRLVGLIPDEGCVLVYNMAFEQGILRDLAERFPSLAPKLMTIHDNIRDLMIPFKERSYYTREMQGSYSLKYVLPALLPELAYDALAVRNGAEAVRVYKGLADMEEDALRQQVQRELLEYCRLDTYAMWRLLAVLRNAAG